MAEKISAFKASDGKLFSTPQEAKQWEASLKWIDQINKFRDSGLAPYPSGTYAVMTQKIIVAWETFKSQK